MKFELRFSNSAVRDIEDILRYTLATFGEHQHAVYRDLIRLALNDIAAKPKAFPAKSRPDLHPDALTFHLSRRGKAASHFFLYKVVDEKFVHIARLLHDSMNVMQHLPDRFR